ncbi:MAG: hypothetical protein ACR2HF_10765 [Methylococcaceae bacterium]
MTKDVIEYLRYIAVLEDAMSFSELSGVQQHRPQRLNKVFSTNDVLSVALDNIDYLAFIDSPTKDSQDKKDE